MRSAALTQVVIDAATKYLRGICGGSMDNLSGPNYEVKTNRSQTELRHPSLSRPRRKQHKYTCCHVLCSLIIFIFFFLLITCCRF